MRERRRALILPREHGAWGILLIPLATGAAVGVSAGGRLLPLVPLTAAFFAGRLVSYSIYVTAASLAADSLGDVLRDVIGSPLGIALQLVMLGLLVALYRVDWARVAARHGHESGRATD